MHIKMSTNAECTDNNKPYNWFNVVASFFKNSFQNFKFCFVFEFCALNTRLSNAQ